ncbi:DnaD domain protein [Mediterraneibacter glycyrrhizinilyticus]|uniref:DnaD domain protein n=1 Tax=Mediterraneibacter glycyrrhizinilyticus TaxID=342942 RepID=UPI0018A0AE08|nr:DnaD domain protein [Mediterraneibacter glycyrrhizinilyticus]
MKTLILKNKYQVNATLVANDFIDHYMSKANGEFVKVYLFLLRHLDDPYSQLTISTIADSLDNTEKDILRAFRYWESEGLLSLEKDADDQIIGLSLEKTICVPLSHPTPPDTPTTPGPGGGKSLEALPGEEISSAASFMPDVSASDAPISDIAAPSAAVSAVPVQTPVAQPIPLDSFRAQKELKSLLFIAEQYLGKTLTKTDMDAITYFYDTLGMSADLIEYLIESCVENGHKSIRYIQKVALSWFDDGVRTVAEARQRSVNYNKNCYAVMNAFGLKNRAPGEAELAYIKKWSEEFGFTLDIILEACNRTISATHQPSFEYTDSILQKWRSRQVRKIQDIAALDAAFQKERSRSAAVSRVKPAARNLNNFDRRSYDMDSLEERLLNSN